MDRNCEKGTISLSQENFIREILECHGMSNSCPISTPALANKHLVKLKSPEISAKSYQHALSALMYPMLGTHPDLGYAIAALGHHAANPGPDHQHALKCVFRYLKATSNQQLVFGCGTVNSSTLLSYAKSDWATDINDHKLMLGYVFTLAGTAVS